MEDSFLSALLEHGSIGILCIGLAFGMRVLWKRNDEMNVKYDDVQRARLLDRESITKALIESTHAIEEMMQYLNTRRRG